MTAVARRPIVPNAVLGTMIFLFTEVMVFCALISAYLVVRTQAPEWPPPDQPRLPAAATLLNTAILVAGGVLMWRDRGVRVPRSTIVSGAAFLALQGFEWAQLIGHGLTTSSSLYGSFFYTIVGCHALHALAGLAAIGLARTEGAIAAARIYWTFVVAIWPPLYVAVYLW